MHYFTNDIISSGRLWRFDPEQLQPGDVVLERGHSLSSDVIMFVDQGEFSHALLWLGGTDFLEAVRGGVRVISVVRVVVNNPLDWIVLRLPDASLSSQAVQHARNMAHKWYDWVGAINTKVPLRNSIDNAALFCSQLVATAYSEAGAHLVDGVDPSQVTPNMLHQQSSLQIVQPIPLVELDLSIPEEDVFFSSLKNRDAAYAESLMDRERRISQTAFRLVQNTFAGIKVPDGYSGKCPPGNLIEAIGLLQVINLAVATTISDRLTEILTTEGYFNLLDGKIEPLIYEIMVDLARLQTGSLTGEDARRMVKTMKISLVGNLAAVDRHSTNANTYEFLIRNRELSIFQNLLNMHRLCAIKFGILVQKKQELLQGCHQFLNREDE